MIAWLKIGPFWSTFGTFGIFGSLLAKSDIHESVLQIYGDSKRPDHYDLFCKLIAVIAAGAPVGVFAVWLRLRLWIGPQKFLGAA